MGKFEERKDGYFILEGVKVGVVSVPPMVFKRVDIPLEKVSKDPKPDGFYLHIEDIK